MNPQKIRTQICEAVCDIVAGNRDAALSAIANLSRIGDGLNPDELAILRVVEGAFNEEFHGGALAYNFYFEAEDLFLKNENHQAARQMHTHLQRLTGESKPSCLRCKWWGNECCQVPEELDPLDSIGLMIVDCFDDDNPDPEEVAKRCGFYRMNPDVIADEQLELQSNKVGQMPGQDKGGEA